MNLTSDKSAPLTGNFMGNKLPEFFMMRTQAYQEINANFLSNMDQVMNKPGQSTLHETTEGYKGALHAIKSGVNIPPATINDGDNAESIYTKAHNSVIPQSGIPKSYFLDSSGKEGNPNNPNFNPHRMEYWIGNPEKKFHTINIPRQ